MSAPQYAKGASAAGPQNYYGSADEPSSSYTRPPPAYSGAEEALLGDEALLTGAPRSSEDNIPDDFKFGGSVSEGTVEIRHAFVRKVYAILTVQLLATAVVSTISFFNESFKSWIQTNSWMMFISLFGSLGFLFATYWKRKSYPTNLLFLSAFTLLEAYTIAVVTSFYDSGIVLKAVVLTGGLFVGLTLFACQTKYDFSSWAVYLYSTLWFLVIFGFVAAFFPSNSTVELVYSGVSALLFSGYILFDTQLIMRKVHVEEEIAAAISLYLDIINLFLALLRILNSSNDS